jgi:hypothetical protein
MEALEKKISCPYTHKNTTLYYCIEVNCQVVFVVVTNRNIR